MKVVEFIKKANQKKTLSFNRLIELKQYYMSMYRHYMLKMYNENYIDDPTVFDRKQIIQNIVDLDVKGLYDLSGVLHLDTKWIEYAYPKNKSKEAKDFLELLHSALKYREYSEDLDMFYEKFNLSVSLSLVQEGARVSLRSRLHVSRGSLCAMTSKGNTLKVLNIRVALWKLGMQILEIPEEDWESDGVLDSDLTHEQEVHNVNILFEGLVKCDGRYATKLEEWLFKHKWSSDKMSITKQGLVSYIYSSKSNEVFAALSEKLNSVDPLEVLALQEDEVYIIQNIKNYKIPVSSFALVSGYEDNMVCDNNALYGYVGEAYDMNYLNDEGFSYMGLPVKVMTSDSELYLIDREQIDMQSDTWFSVENIDFYYEELDWKNPYSDKDSLNYKMFEIYKDAQIGILGSVSLEDYTLKDIELSKKQVTAKIVKGV